MNPEARLLWELEQEWRGRRYEGTHVKVWRLSSGALAIAHGHDCKFVEICDPRTDSDIGEAVLRGLEQVDQRETLQREGFREAMQQNGGDQRELSLTTTKSLDDLGL